MTESQATVTRICARILGPLMLIIGAIVIARFNDLVLIIPAILQDSPLAFITGLFTLICGVTLFAFHHHWNDITSIVISLLAILTAVRGIILMFAPTLFAGIATNMLNAGPGALVAGVIALLIGAWLTFIGWFRLPSAH